ncbi:MAG: RNA methyltransferase [Candidatus Pacebacteria bacterium]|nr:RNA methyltransferase [Candidatus Paceibacterota bacterium]
MNKKIVVVLDNIRSRENVGSIFRTSDAAGVTKLCLCGITPLPPHEKISKTALGAELDIPWEHHKQTWRLLDNLRKDGYKIVALEKSDSAKDVFDLGLLGDKIVLVLGNEVDGLSPEIIKRSDVVAVIPMMGKKESLNVSVAFGIAVYQIALKYSKNT